MILLKNRDRKPNFKSGKYIEINDAGNYPMELSVDGVCEQETTTGKNKLPYTNDINETINSTKIIGVKGTYTIQTTPTATVYQTYVNLVENYTIQSGDYLHIMNNVASSSIVFNLRATDNTILSPTLSSVNRIIDLSNYVGKTIKEIRFYIATGYDGTKITLSPMILNSSIATGWEQFTFGASPNPDYPQEIKTLTGNIKVTSCGKNLFDYVSNLKATSDGLTNVINEDGSITTSGKPTSNYSKITNEIIITSMLEDGQTYTISRTNASNKVYVQVLAKRIVDGKYIYINSVKGSNTFKVDKTIYTNYSIMLQTNTISSWGDSPLTITNKYMLCKGTDTADTSFEPYQDSSLNITIPSNEFVGKLDDTYKDTLNVVYKEDGHYHLILNKMVGKVVLNGSEKWALAERTSNTNGVFYINMSLLGINVVNRTNAYSNYAKYSLGYSNKAGQFDIHYSQFRFFAPQRTTTIEDWKKLLASNNLEVYYILETPYEIDLGIVDQLLTFDEITNIFTDSDLYPVINVKYYKDFKFDKILRSGYNIDEQEYEIAKKHMANGKRKRILSSYVDCIIKINLGLLDNKTYQEYKEQLDDGEFHYWSYKYNRYKKANFILTKPSITTEYAYDDDIGINDMEITLEKSSDIE